MADFWDDADVIFSYSRAQALEDGVLIDLTEWAKETGFGFPVAISSAAWDKTIRVWAGMESWGQSERGRAHDVLFMLLWAVKSAGHKQTILYELGVRNEPHDGDAETVTLKAVVGPGDAGEPVITIMLPNED